MMTLTSMELLKSQDSSGESGKTLNDSFCFLNRYCKGFL